MDGTTVHGENMIVANSGQEVFRAMQQIVIEGQDQSVKGPLEDGDGVLVDNYSACMVIQVHGALSSEKQEKMIHLFQSLPIPKVLDMLWGVVRQSRTLH